MAGGRLSRVLKRHTGAVQTVATLLGVFAGIGLGLLLKSIRDERWSPREVMYIKFVGDLHIRFIQALILPIIVSSMISAIGRLDVRMSRGLCVRTLVYYISTTVFAAAFATLMVLWIKPGVMGDGDSGQETVSGCTERNATGPTASNLDSVLDIVRNFSPPNLVGATIESTATKAMDPGDESPFSDWKFEIGMVPGSNLLGIIFISIVYGLTLGSIGQAGKPIVDFFTALMNATMRIMETIIWFFPITTCLLLAGQIVQEEDIGSLFKTLGLYTVAQVVTLVVHGFVFLPLTYWVCIRKNPFPYLRNLGPAIATAFGTNSSSATLPVTMECVQGANGVDERISRFVLPIGATVNMDGTAIYRIIYIHYLARLCGKELPFSELLNVALMAAATSIGAAGLPGATSSVAFLAALGYPIEHYALILPVSWLVGRFSTVTNVVGDAIGAAVILHLSQKDLADAHVDVQVQANTRKEMPENENNASDCNGVSPHDA